MAVTTLPAARSRPWRARAAGVLAALGLVVLAACSTISSLTELVQDLQDAGFSDVSANPDSRNASVLVVSARAPGSTEVDVAQDDAAEVVWTTFPRRFAGLRVTIDGDRREWSYAELEDQLGARPDGLDDKDLQDEFNQLAIYVVLGTLAAGVVGLALIGGVIYLVVRANRRKRALAPPVRPWMPPGVPTGSLGPPTGTPSPPPGGWTPHPTGPPSPTPPPHPPGPPSLAKEPPPAPPAPAPQPEPPPAPAAEAAATGRDPDARRLGRRPRGPKPDAAHTPPGWG